MGVRETTYAAVIVIQNTAVVQGGGVVEGME